MLFPLSITVGLVLIFLADQFDRYRARRRRKDHIWAGWSRCEGCHGLYPRMSSDTPGFCSEECHEINQLESISKL